LQMADPKVTPEFVGTIAAIETRPFKRSTEQSPSGFGYHWNHNAESHFLIGDAMGEAMVKLLKN
ncbi:MAG: sialate O-acetylesterase, partial [Akkermansiaceae bacterium]